MKQLAATIGLLSLSLATLICSGVAWIITNSSVGVSYSNMQFFDPTEDDIIQGYHFYNSVGTDMVTVDGVTTEYVYFDTEETFTPQVGLYDRQLDTHNHQLLIEVEINPEYAGRYLMPFASVDENPIPNKTWADIDWENGASFPLSLIIAMKVYGIAAPTTAQVTLTNYSEGNAYQVPYDVSNMDSFISFGATSENPIFTTPIDIDNGDTSTAGYQIGENLRVYMILDYDEDAVSAIYSHNLGSERFSSETPIKFYSDFLIAFREVV